MNLYVFRHAETTDNARGIFSGWRDPKLTEKGLGQAKQIALQLKNAEINYAFTSSLRRAKRTLEIVLQDHPDVPVFVDDRLIERCYGLLQGKSKKRLKKERPEWFAKIHRAYDFPPPEGESLRMVHKRTIAFLRLLEAWLRKHPGNTAISCHGNSIRPIRKTFEQLSLKQMCQLETPQDKAIKYALRLHEVRVVASPNQEKEPRWEGMLVPKKVKLSSDPRNPLKKYYR
ncbi:histidine phosphatase family protein [Candidatus Bathyarchaeota archaeon]|nr:histidine phosphatase family protein [Candidatus Bathyarchaeota archaeon]